MKIKLFIINAIALFIVYGCGEDMKEPLIKNQGIPPEVEHVRIENIPGGAKIYYVLPENSDILYVVAEFYAQKEIKREVKSSRYNNYLMLEGFSEEKEYPVTLYTVSRSEVRSNGIITSINPLKSPLNSIRETLSVFETFGGVMTNFTNELEKEYIFYTLIKDEESGEWIEYDRLYTQSKNRDYAIRGLESKALEFGFYFSDKWKNNSDTLIMTLTPLYEIECDKSLWSDANLSDDSNEAYFPGAWDLANLWDNGDKFFYQPDSKYSIPNWVTINLGKKYRFSRMRYNQLTHHDTWKFADGAPQIFEIWGTNNPITNWDAWTLLGKFESVKPSGLPVGQFTEEDYAVNISGEEYDFQPMQEEYQYIRFKTIKTWGNTRYICFKELTLWGQ